MTLNICSFSVWTLHNSLQIVFCTHKLCLFYVSNTEKDHAALLEKAQTPTPPHTHTQQEPTVTSSYKYILALVRLPAEAERGGGALAGIKRFHGLNTDEQKALSCVGDTKAVASSPFSTTNTHVWGVQEVIIILLIPKTKSDADNVLLFLKKKKSTLAYVEVYLTLSRAKNGS